MSYTISKNNLSELLLNQSNKVVCENSLKKLKKEYDNILKKYMELRDIWKKYSLSSKKTHNDLQLKYNILHKKYYALNDERKKLINTVNNLQKKYNKLYINHNNSFQKLKLLERKNRRGRLKNYSNFF